MTVTPSIDPARMLEEHLAQASPDLLRELLSTFINTLLSAEADAVCGAGYGTTSPERVNRRNGYRHRDFDTRTGTLDVAIPKLRQGSYFRGWLLERRKRAERALTSVDHLDRLGSRGPLRYRPDRLRTPTLPRVGPTRADNAGAAGVGTAGQPNIVIVLTDDQRVGSMKRMPAVWSLIRQQGVRYPNAMAPTSLCCPSRASLLTGLYAHHTRVYSNGLPDGGWERFHQRGLEDRTLAVALHNAGYETGMFGKYLNGSFPRRAAAGFVPPGWDTMVTFTTQPGYFNYRLNDGTKHGSGPDDYSTDVLAAHAVDFIRGVPANKPLFAYFAPVGPHRPFTPAHRHSGAWGGRLPPHQNPAVSASVATKPPWIRKYRRVPQKKIDAQIAMAQEALMSVDDSVRDLVQALTDTGRMQNTMFIFLSDNGLMVGEHHLNPWKNVPYRWSTCVPMTIRWDGHLPANRTDNRLALNIDVATTIADATSARMSTDGLSLLRARTRTGFPLEGAEWHRFDSLPRHPAYCGWRTKDWMYAQYATGEQELYHYRDDRQELHDLSDRPAHRARLLKMRAAAKAACKPLPPSFRWPRG